jgi:sporulation protein YlmC with PRC-barrel domain
MSTASGHTTAIRAKKVLGTTVKDGKGDTIGKVEDVVLDKLSNNIMFAVVSFGGFLGMGEKYHPLPWSLLQYDENDGNYVVSVSKEQLKAAPAYEITDLTKGDGMVFRDAAFNYYKTPRYWQ